MNRLRTLFPWPDTKPTGSEEIHGWHFPEVQEALLPALEGAKIILELGSYHGVSTRWFCDNSDATVIAVDHWKGSPHQHRDETLKGDLPLLYETFCEASWDYRDRIIPVRMQTLDAIDLIHTLGIEPDLVYLDASHEETETFWEAYLILDRFPNSKLYGDDYDWPSVRRALQSIQDEVGFPICNNGRAWWVGVSTE